MGVNFKGTKYFNLPAIGVWTTLQVSHQVNEAGNPIFSIVVGGVEVHKEKIPFKTGITDVKVFSAPLQPLLPAHKGYIKDIIIESKE